jgi:hypothetical protein
LGPEDASAASRSPSVGTSEPPRGPDAPEDLPRVVDSAAADRPGFASYYPEKPPAGCDCIWPLLTECFPPISDPCVREHLDAGEARCFASGAKTLLWWRRGVTQTQDIWRPNGTLCMTIVYSDAGIQYFDGKGRDVAFIRRKPAGRWDLECAGATTSFMTDAFHPPCSYQGFPMMICKVGSCQP